ncbi:methyl-accepting chemotaxis protein [Cardiobacterium valvarum]|uniref:Methyl-accepting chemotaxis protein signaling domain protein n=1 Tax=Cardiobacterium valvarum F0432 TaxID=797473 RepID=G9ZFH7_9GAMM|nr:methyl-accepting chemotaxis protein [Cardiobacterium valvarum]EHM53948.1 methyl-accepting chemotaxis protein signaling domain protein [Cardiobacterium valvarum F0432]
MLNSRNRIIAAEGNSGNTFRIAALACSGIAAALALFCLFQIYFGDGGMLGTILPAMIVCAALAGFLWYKFVDAQYSKIQHVSTEAEFRAKRDQDAILRLMDELAEFSNGDLTVEAQVTEDFTGAIADSVNYAIESMRELVGTINRTSTQVSNASNSTRLIAEQMQSSSTEQAQKIHTINKIIGDMVRSLDRVAISTSDSAEIAHNSVSIAREGAQQVRNTINGMNNIRGNIQETRTLIKRLGESSQEIGNIVEIIKSIADQTNILALNAAIQANSAGEAGRGFAVVADEVQRLAERSSNATKRIEGLVKTIQNDTNAAVASMERSTKEVVEGANIAEEAGTALSKIEDVSTSLASLIEKVSDSTRKVSTMAEGIASDMAQINQMAVTTTENVVKTSDSIENLSLLSQELKNSVSGFKLPVGY